MANADDLEQLMSQATVDVLLAGRVLGFARNASYRAAARGDIPTIKVGNRLRVPTSKLRELLSLPAQAGAHRQPFAA